MLIILSIFTISPWILSGEKWICSKWHVERLSESRDVFNQVVFSRVQSSILSCFQVVSENSDDNGLQDKKMCQAYFRKIKWFMGHSTVGN